MTQHNMNFTEKEFNFSKIVLNPEKCLDKKKHADE